MPYVLFVIVCVIWGSSFILMKKATDSFGPLSIGAWRLLGGAAVIAVAWWFKRPPAALRWAHAPPLTFVVVLGYLWPYAWQPHLVAHHGSAFVAMMVSFVPVLTVMVSIPMLGVWPSARQLTGVIGGLACLAVLLADGLARRIPVIDLSLAASVPLCYALANTCIRKRLSDVPALTLTLAALTISGALLLPFSWLAPRLDVSVTGSWRWSAFFSLVLLGVVGTGIAMLMFYKLIRDQGPLFAGMVSYLIPVGGLVWGWVDHEPVSAPQVGALAGILVMVAFVQYRAAVPAPHD